jgi:hypothetical protein
MDKATDPCLVKGMIGGVCLAHPRLTLRLEVRCLFLLKYHLDPWLVEHFRNLPSPISFSVVCRLDFSQTFQLVYPFELHGLPVFLCILQPCIK